MSDATTILSPERALAAIQDRIEITDVLYRYASTIDSFDLDGLRATLDDEIVAQYGNAEQLSGADAVTGWIAEQIAPVVWQHHLLSVYHVDVDGDEAKALVYHTSHQLFEAEPENPKLLVGRYRNELRRTPAGWKISKLELELLWGESRTDSAGFFASIGGRGPIR